MSSSDFERRLSVWLEQGPVSAPRDVVDAALARAASVPQAKRIGLPWPRWPRLALPAPDALARAALSLAVLVLAVVAGLWAVNNLPPVPASSPSPTAGPTETAGATPTAGPTTSPVPTEGATPAQPAISVPQLAYVGQSGRQNAFGVSVVYQLAIANSDAFAPDFFEQAPELGCIHGGTPDRMTVEIRDAQTDTVLGHGCSDLDFEALTFELQLGHPPVASAYVELVDRVSSQTSRSNLVAIPEPEWPVPSSPAASPRLVAGGQFDDVAITPAGAGAAYVVAAVGIGASDARGVVMFAPDGTGWRTETVSVAPPGQDGTEYDGEIDVATDTDGSVWIAFTRYSCGGCTPTVSDGVYVTSNVSGSWLDPVLVAGAGSHAPSIAVRDGVAHLAYAVASPGTRSELHYASNGSGSWVSRLLKDDGREPELGLGPDALPWIFHAGDDGVRLLTADGNGDFSDESPPGGFTDSVERPRMSIAGEVAHVVWSELSGASYWARRTADGWTAPEPIALGHLRHDAIVGDEASSRDVYISSRSAQIGGAWLVQARNGSVGSVALVRGEVTMTDISMDSEIVHMAYAYAGPLAPSGIWYYRWSTDTE